MVSEQLPGRPMAGENERRAWLVSLLVAGANNPFRTKRLCQVCAEVTAMGGVGIMLMEDDRPQRSLCTTNEMSDLIEQLQYALDEGPAVDAYRRDGPVTEPDLVGAGARRWPTFAPAAVRAGVLAVFGYPLRVGAVRLGALSLWRDRPGPLDDGQHAAALVMADIGAEAALVLQAAAARAKPPPEVGVGRDLGVVRHVAGWAGGQFDPPAPSGR